MDNKKISKPTRVTCTRMKTFVLAAVLSLPSAFAANPAQPPQGQPAAPARVLQIQTFSDKQFVKYFIDDTIEADPIDFNMDTLADIANKTDLFELINKAYHKRCIERSSTDLSTFKPVFLHESCPVELTTNTDFNDFIG